MKIPDPVPGLVIRYTYLWYDDSVRGRLDGDKARPCAIVIASRESGLVTVVPITHSPPSEGEESLSIEVPAEIARAIGLDAEVNYVRLEANRFQWSEVHLRPVPGHPERAHYGMIPKSFFDEIRKRLADLVRQNLLRHTRT